MTHKGEANSRQAGQEILRLVWNSTVDFRARKTAPTDYTLSILSWSTSLHTVYHNNLPSTPLSSKCTMPFKFSA